jgi:hypothetical protein
MVNHSIVPGRSNSMMITSDKLAIYRKYAGDVDGWQLSGGPQRDAITGAEWAAITNILQELTAYKRNLVSQRYAEQIRERLTQLAADDDVARQIMDLA